MSIYKTKHLKSLHKSIEDSYAIDAISRDKKTYFDKKCLTRKAYKQLNKRLGNDRD